jgi:hypothetical protein
VEEESRGKAQKWKDRQEGYTQQTLEHSGERGKEKSKDTDWHRREAKRQKNASRDVRVSCSQQVLVEEVVIGSWEISSEERRCSRTNSSEIDHLDGWVIDSGDVYRQVVDVVSKSGEQDVTKKNVDQFVASRV